MIVGGLLLIGCVCCILKLNWIWLPGWWYGVALSDVLLYLGVHLMRLVEAVDVVQLGVGVYAAARLS